MVISVAFKTELPCHAALGLLDELAHVSAKKRGVNVGVGRERVGTGLGAGTVLDGAWDDRMTYST